MDTTKAEPNPSTDSQTLPDDSRTVADSGPRPRLPMSPADIRDHELIRRIGQGSYGEVWLARNVMGTYRAVKIVYRERYATLAEARRREVEVKRLSRAAKELLLSDNRTVDHERQRELWEREHRKPHMLQPMDNSEPSSAVVWLASDC